MLTYIDGIVDVLLVAVEDVKSDSEIGQSLRSACGRLLLLFFLSFFSLFLLLLFLLFRFFLLGLFVCLFNLFLLALLL